MSLTFKKFRMGYYKMVLSINNSSAADVGLYNEKEHEYFEDVIYLLQYLIF